MRTWLAEAAVAFRRMFCSEGGRLSSFELGGIKRPMDQPDDREQLNADMVGQALGEFAKRVIPDDEDAQRVKLAMSGIGKALSYQRHIPTVEEAIAILEIFTAELDRLPPRAG